MNQQHDGQRIIEIMKRFFNFKNKSENVRIFGEKWNHALGEIDLFNTYILLGGTVFIYDYEHNDNILYNSFLK